MAESTAWILDFGNSIRAAVGDLNLVHLEEQAQLFTVPKAPNYCRQAMIWQDTIIPVIDMVTGLQGQSIERENNYVVILRYQPILGTLMYGALLLSDMPVRITVNDNLACPLPKQPQAWQTLAVSCFTLDDKAVPVIGLSRLFSKDAQKILAM